jgi:tetratricopeptide (TPR) repeat protein
VLLIGTIISTTLAIRAAQATAQAKVNEQRARDKEKEALASADQALRAADAERQARLSAEVQRKQSMAISRFMANATRIPGGWRDSRMEEILARSEREVQTKFDDSPTKMDLLHVIAESYYGLGLYHNAIPLWEQVRDYLVATFGPDHPTALSASGNLAVVYRQVGRLDEARRLFEETLERMQRTLGAEHQQTRITMVHLAEQYRKVGRLDEALPLAEEGLKLSLAERGPDHSETLWAMEHLADVYLADSQLDEAFRLYDERVSRSKTALGPDHPDTIAAMRSLADKYARRGRHSEAASEFTRLLQINPDDHGSALRAALHYLAADDQKGYEAVCRQMLGRFAHAHDGWAANRTSLACLMSTSPIGDVQELVRLADLAVAAFDKDAKLVDRMISCRTRGLAAYRAGDFHGALEWCQESRALEAQRSSHHPYLATNLIIEAMAWYQQGNPAEARAAFDESARLIEQSFPNAPVDLGSDWFDWLAYDLLRREAVGLLRFVSQQSAAGHPLGG